MDHSAIIEMIPDKDRFALICETFLAILLYPADNT
jgi:hypothetical protein